MSWPTPQEYNEAVQNPRSNFTDPQLRASTPELTSLGIPRPITGNFASVYRMSANGSDTAVRCFFRDYVDMPKRYSLVSSHLETIKLPYTVGFQYLPREIRVRGQQYPVLKMEWAGGKLLDQYVRANISNPRRLSALAATWLRLARDLKAANVAHGDLQHGNVIITAGRIRLVDYDGMFVPGLDGAHSLELGHPNYQHPARDGSLFGPGLDNFSHWIIYTSLLALSLDPTLWDVTHAGDERLLLSRNDFQNPNTSNSLAILLNHPNERIRFCAGSVRDFLDLDPALVPPLQEPAAPVRPASIRRRRQASPILRATSQTTMTPAWLQDHVKPDPPRQMVSAPPALRLYVLILTLASALFLLPMATAIGGVPARFGISTCLLAVALLVPLAVYRQDPAARELRHLSKRWDAEARMIRRLERSLGRQESRLLRRLKKLEDQKRRIARRRDCVEAKLVRKRALLEAQVRGRLTQLTALLGSIDAEQKEIMARRLQKQRDRFMDRRLERSRLPRAHLPGVGLQAKCVLYVAGIHSAADVNTDHIEAIRKLGPRVSRALIQWQIAVLREAVREAPAALPFDQSARIIKLYSHRRTRVHKLRKEALTDAAPLLKFLSIWSQANAADATDRLARLGVLEKELRGGRSTSDHHVTQEIQLHGSRLESIEADLSRYRNVSFPRYMTGLLAGKRIGERLLG